jgi:hypothetical protein
MITQHHRLARPGESAQQSLELPALAQPIQ